MPRIDMGSLLPSRGLFSIEDLSKDQILGILDRAEELCQSKTYPQSLVGKIVGLLFFQPSTRTRIGFHCAAQRLGGGVVELNEAKFQLGMSCAESIADTVRCVSAYCHLLVIRHPEVNEVKRAMEASAVPVIDGGAGTEHHPTQTLIDLFAIRRRLGRLDGLRIGMAGDLAGSRCAKDLARALQLFPLQELRLMTPPGRGLPESLLDGLKATRVDSSHNLRPGSVDVLYMAGCQPGESVDAVGEQARINLRLTPNLCEEMKTDAMILCPLPRVDEIDGGVDSVRQAAYFAQSAAGLFVRMAVMESCVGVDALHGARAKRKTPGAAQPAEVKRAKHSA